MPDTLLVFFFIYSFIGWLIEVGYRSYTRGAFVNAGFLRGPFVPIYGFGALLVIMISELFPGACFFIEFILFGAVLSFLEYMVGFFGEQYFKIKLWDYSENSFNLHGRICLLYSLFWAAMATLLINFIHPALEVLIAEPGSGVTGTIVTILLIALMVDFTVSVFSLKSFRDNMAYFFENYLDLDNEELEKYSRSFRRFLEAFPDLNKYFNDNIGNGLREKIDSILNGINRKVQDGLVERQPDEEEFYKIVGDILGNEEFLKLKNFFHHNGSIYEHAIDVSYYAYKISRYLGLDYYSAARGGLLHDFFLYDWRNHDSPDLDKKKSHGIWHSKIALKNAEKEFTLNAIERDIVLKHMWPLTLVPPLYRESFVVSFVDKYLSSREFFGEIKKNIQEKRSSE